jgi:transposase
MNSSPEELIGYMKKHYPGGRYVSAYEAGFCGFWIHGALQAGGFTNYVVNPADIPTSDKEKTQKTDSIDSRKICRELAKDNLNGIYIPNLCMQQLRTLCRLRDRAVKHQTRLKNRIRGYLHNYGIQTPNSHEIRAWSKCFFAWLASLEFAYESGSDCLTLCVEELHQQQVRIKTITRCIKRHIRQYGYEADYKRLLSVPGVGNVLAMTLLCEIMDIHRFKRFDQLKSYVGLIPSVENSGEKVRERGLTRRRNALLQYLIIEAAWVAIRSDPALLLAYQKLLRRMKGQDAIIRIARKLLNRIYSIWKNETTYVPAVVQ